MMSLTAYDEWQLLIVKLFVLCSSFAGFMYIGKDVLAHYKFAK